MKYNLYSKMEKFFSNKLILNFIVAISFLNIIAFIMLNETVAIIYFILLGLITSYFSKNMGIVLLVPLIVVNLLIARSTSLYRREGLENKSDSDKSKEYKTTKKPASTSTSSSNQSLVVTPLDHSNPEKIDNTEDNSGDVGEPFEVGRNNKNKNKKGYDIDYASTVEDAYDELNKILGGDGIKRLTNDTQNLVKQQMKLAESMKSMEPLIAGMAPIMKQAEGLLGSLGDNGNMGNLAEIAKKFNVNLGNQ